MGAPKIIVPSGYDPSLDRLPARPGPGCAPMIKLIFVLFGVIGGGVWLLLNVISGQSQPQRTEPLTPPPSAIPLQDSSPTPIPTNTLDAWSATGTAIVFQPPTATQDYCWFLTPTATATAILLITPDAWSATGTAIYRRENPPTPMVSPTATTPKSWCDYEPATATPTPILLVSRTNEPATSATPAPSATRTAFPIQPAPVQTQPLVIVQPTDAPPVIMPTLAPPTAAPTKKPKKTKTPTLTPSATFTYMPTLTPWPTETATPTPTPTLTATFTETATLTPSVTLAPPVIVLYSADCLAGPLFFVQNLGGAADGLGWAIETVIEGEVLIAAAGTWGIELNNGAIAPAAAPAWAEVYGLYRLTVAGMMVGEVACHPATPTPTPTPTETAIDTRPTFEPETTLEPVYTPTPEGQS